MLVDPDKDLDNAIAMVVLGMSARMAIAESNIYVGIDEMTAAQWGRELLVASVSGHMQPTLAAKMAGRLQWA